MRSLRFHLLAWLIPPLLVVGIAAAGGAYIFMERRLTAAYDQDLGDIAQALLPYLRAKPDGISLELTDLAVAVLKADSSDQIFYSVRDASGRLVAGDNNLLLPEGNQDNPLHFWDDTLRGNSVRSVAYHARVAGLPVTVIAAETTRKRDRAARDAMVSAIAPVVLLSVAAVVAILFGVRRGLGPIGRLRAEVQARSHRDLRPVGESHGVEELRPLVQELNDMLSRLKDAQQTQATFIANAAHQLRTPIAGLVTQLHLVSSDSVAHSTHLAHATEAATRLARLAQQILSLAVADPISNPEIADADCDLAGIVKDHASTWLRAATARGVEIEFALEPAPIRGSALLVGELASNLIDNASRYGAKTVTVTTTGHADGRAFLEVADDGPGIPAAERTRIFERFRRIDNHSTAGSGLGLAIVREIAQRHHADVALSEGSGGRGTLVTVSFPPPAAVAV
jgi:two-component system sensor histidine kinase TctE